MRTTIELSDFHRGILHQLALKKRWRGYSNVIKEILDFYLTHQERTQQERLEILKLKGAFTDKEADEMRAQVMEVRGNWKE